VRVAVVTGASRGLGAAIARNLAADGYAVAITYARDYDAAQRVLDSVAAGGGRAVAFCFDVRDQAEVADAMRKVVLELGPIEVVVSNAISEHRPHPIEGQTWDHYTELLEFSVKAPLSLMQSVLPDWKQRRSGCFINIGSESLALAKAQSGPYLAAKAALIGLSRSWAQELGPHNIRVNVVAPGFVPVERHVDVSLAERESYARHVPLKRLGKSSEVADLVSFLASDRASFITGQVLYVNGGRTMT
jgi:3-oxoacyl-[acyl-carrier protein] reductase